MPNRDVAISSASSFTRLCPGLKNCQRPSKYTESERPQGTSCVKGTYNEWSILLCCMEVAQLDSAAKLSDLRGEFLTTSTQSMPIAGIIYWSIVAVAALYVPPDQLGYIVGFGSGLIFPFGVLIDLLRGRKMKKVSPGNPVAQLFFQSLGLVALLWPLVIIAAILAHDANLIVLGGAVLMGIIWIPYGWAADDPVGLQHAIGRSILSYACFLFAPEPYKATAISVAVLLSYTYSLIRMRKA